jgi:hypothetical protein
MYYSSSSRNTHTALVRKTSRHPFFSPSSSILAGALELGFVGRLPLLDKGLRVRELAAKRRT